MDDPAYDAFFHEAYDSYHRAVFAYILARVGQREMAKDLMQEAFLRAWNQIHVGYEMGRVNCRFWIFRITKNLITDYYRRRTTRDQAEGRMRQDAIVRGAFGRSPEEAYEIKSNVQHIEDAVSRLPDELRSVLILHLVGQMNSAEIGELLEIPAGTVRYRISLARKRVMLELTNNETSKEGRTIEGFGLE
ncbi:RNA polymerase sigma factor [Paenibacillus hemerocallicola]|jgi:RNA polymerase sigma-70 factor (ECF subfamily)|uniref:RNA polymerase sigma factor n=1 Tax=Paenibacillus hemerocallicola TaxID=1172614 RepID=A0A5C4T7Z2_9BACL|nr:RNA polymerase sigma factor [Paenibacillus hemerocallicola]TNJ64429.1 RNA polymerase sigma factor [Paenibacillus hemerocallicola]